MHGAPAGRQVRFVVADRTGGGHVVAPDLCCRPRGAAGLAACWPASRLPAVRGLDPGADHVGDGPGGAAMTGATPRPWRVGVDGDVFAGGHVVSLIADADGDQVEAANVLSTNISKAEARANAALIVRAVNHHDALVTFVQAVADYLHQLDPRTLRDDARALLARIKGEA